MRGYHPVVVAAMCLLVASEGHAQLRGRAYSNGFTLPVAFVQDPTDRNVQFVVQQGGRIRVLQNGRCSPPIS